MISCILVLIQPFYDYQNPVNVCLLLSVIPNLALIGKWAWVQEPSEVQKLVKYSSTVVRFSLAGQKNTTIRAKFGQEQYTMGIHSRTSNLALRGEGGGYRSPEF